MSRMFKKKFSAALNAVRDGSVTAADGRHYCCVNSTRIAGITESRPRWQTERHISHDYFELMLRAGILGDAITAGEFSPRYRVPLPVKSDTLLRLVDDGALLRAEEAFRYFGTYFEPADLLDYLDRGA